MAKARPGAAVSFAKPLEELLHRQGLGSPELVDLALQNGSVDEVREGASDVVDMDGLHLGASAAEHRTLAGEVGQRAPHR